MNAHPLLGYACAPPQSSTALDFVCRALLAIAGLVGLARHRGHREI